MCVYVGHIFDGERNNKADSSEEEKTNNKNFLRVAYFYFSVPRVSYMYVLMLRCVFYQFTMATCNRESHTHPKYKKDNIIFIYNNMDETV